MKELFKKMVILVLTHILPNVTIEQLENIYLGIKQGMFKREDFSDEIALALKFYEIYNDLC